MILKVVPDGKKNENVCQSGAGSAVFLKCLIYEHSFHGRF